MLEKLGLPGAGAAAAPAQSSVATRMPAALVAAAAAGGEPQTSLSSPSAATDAAAQLRHSGGAATLLYRFGAVAPSSSRALRGVPPQRQASTGAASAASGGAAAVPPLRTGLWDGAEPGEGAAHSPATALWTAIEAAIGRDARLAERAGDASVFSAPAAAAVGSDAGGTATADWREMCRVIAIAAEDDAEALAARGGDAGTDAAQSNGVDWDADGDGDEAFAPSPGAAVATAPTGAAASTAKPAPAAEQLLHPAEAVARTAVRYVGEPFCVSFTLRNPLAMELPVVGLRLLHEWSEGVGGAETDAPQPRPGAARACDDDAWIPMQDGGDTPTAVTADGVCALAIDLLLAPYELRTVRAVIRPLRAGSLVVTGAVWSIAALVECRHDWALKGPPLNDTRANKVSGARAVDRRLHATVRPRREWAGAQIIGLTPPAPVGAASARATWGAPPGSLAAAAVPPEPPAVLEGEMRPCELELANLGGAPLDVVVLRVAGKGAVCVAVEDARARTGQGAVLPLDGLDGATARLPIAAGTKSWLVGRAPAELPSGNLQGTLLPGERVRWRLLVRATAPGLRTLRMVVWYGAADGKDAAAGDVLPSRAALSTLRRLRLCLRLRVLPSLAVRTFIEPHPIALAGTYLMRVAVAHIGADATAARLHMTSASASDAASAAPTAGQLPIQVLGITGLSAAWQLQLIDVAPLQRKQGSSVDLLQLAAPPLAEALSLPINFGEARLYTFVLVAPAEAPQTAKLPSDGAAGAALRLRAGALHGGVSDAGVALIRAARASVAFAARVAWERRREHASRLAAAATDALPPTLRSIAQERAAAGRDAVADASGDGGASRLPWAAGVAPLPSSLGSLAAAGRAAMHIAVRWRAGVRDGAAVPSSPATCEALTDVCDIPTSLSLSSASAGGPWPQWGPDISQPLPLPPQFTPPAWAALTPSVSSDLPLLMSAIATVASARSNAVDITLFLYNASADDATALSLEIALLDGTGASATALTAATSPAGAGADAAAGRPAALHSQAPPLLPPAPHSNLLWTGPSVLRVASLAPGGTARVTLPAVLAPAAAGGGGAPEAVAIGDLAVRNTTTNSTAWMKWPIRAFILSTAVQGVTQ